MTLHYRRAKREWALTWRRSGRADDLRFAQVMRDSERAWARKEAR
jgi:hypothetical protein